MESNVIEGTCTEVENVEVEKAAYVLPYTISSSNPDSSYRAINIDYPNPLSPPSKIVIGVGDKGKRYKAYLDTAFNPTNSNLLHSLAFIHKTGIQHGDVVLTCSNGHKCPLNKVNGPAHSRLIKEWLEENGETLSAIIPYLFPVPQQEVTEQPTIIEATPEVKPTGDIASQLAGLNHPNMSSSDIESITRMIAEDQAKSLNETLVVDPT